MRVRHVNVVIRNPTELSRCWERRFLIDADAINSLVPRPHLETIGLGLKGQRVYELADGSEIKTYVTTGDIEFMDEITAGLIIIGDADAEPLMGVAALEFAGVEVDSRSQRLKKLPPDRLRTSSPAATSVSISSGVDGGKLFLHLIDLVERRPVGCPLKTISLKSDPTTSPVVFRYVGKT